MKRICVILLVLAAALCAPQYTDAQTPETFRQEGIASWYGPEFDGRPTASGEIFNSTLLTAAHPTLPFGTILVVTNRDNNKRVQVRVNDRGPFVSARIIDVSKAAAEQLDMIITGTAPVSIESVERVVSAPKAPTQASPDSYWTLPPAAPAPAPVVPPAAPAPTAPAAPAAAFAPASPSVPAAPAAPQAPVPAQTYDPSPAYPQQPAPIIIYMPAPPAAPEPAAVAAPAAAQAGAKIAPNKTYRIQVGSYKVPKNAVDVFEKLKKAGLNPAYERNGEFFRVVLAGIPGGEVPSVTEKLSSAGFRETVAREEN